MSKKIIKLLLNRLERFAIDYDIQSKARDTLEELLIDIRKENEVLVLANTAAENELYKLRIQVRNLENKVQGMALGEGIERGDGFVKLRDSIQSLLVAGATGKKIQAIKETR